MRTRLKAFWQHLRAENNDPGRLAAAVFAGVFLGVVPLYGIQTGICLFVAWLFRLNKLTVIAAGQVSNPLFAPFLIGGSIVIGEWIRYGTVRWPTTEEGTAALGWTSVFSGGVPDIVISCFLGSLVLGLVTGVFAAAVVYDLARRQRARRPDEAVVDGECSGVDGVRRRFGSDPR